MSNSSVQTTAKIIPFPARDRRPAPPEVKSEARAEAVAATDAWYHAAAIQDALLAGNH